jgi:phosphoglycolate phosphatase-like HAD superfamily hydrolase
MPLVSTGVAFRAAVVKQIDKQDGGCVPNALPASASVIRRRAVDLLDACRDVGRPVVIVSNNAEPAIEAFLDHHDLRHLVHAVIGRVPGRPELMKPHPDSVLRALDILDRPPAQCVLIGDSVTDIGVSRATGLRSIGYANTPIRGNELHLAGADAITDSNHALAEHVGHSPATG